MVAVKPVSVMLGGRNLNGPLKTIRKRHAWLDLYFEINLEELERQLKPANRDQKIWVTERLIGAGVPLFYQGTFRELYRMHQPDSYVQASEDGQPHRLAISPGLLGAVEDMNNRQRQIVKNGFQLHIDDAMVLTWHTLKTLKL